MKVKKYFATNMKNALEMVRQDQGPDVLILSNRKVDGGVELVTSDGAIDEQALAAHAAAHTAAHTAGRQTDDAGTERPARVEARPRIRAVGAAPSRRSDAAADVLGGEAEVWTDPALVTEMRRELASLKGLLEHQLSALAWNDFTVHHPLRARLLRQLSRLSIGPALARALVDNVAENVEFNLAWREVMRQLERRIGGVDDGILAAGGRLALYGPTGVGKTLLATKFAAAYALRHGQDSVVLISADDQRIGAFQQLKVFGRLLGIEVVSASAADEMAAALERAQRKSLVIVDTPGMTPEDIRLRELHLRLAGDGFDACLVVAATTEYRSLSHTLQAADELHMDYCAVTKVDEAAALGPVVTALAESALPPAWLGTGQRVPDDVEAASGRALLKRMLRLAEESPQPDDTTVLEQAFAL